MKWLRALVGLLAGLLITLFYALFAFVFGLAYRILIHPIAKHWWSNPVSLAPKLWGLTYQKVCFEWIMGIQTKIEGEFPEPRPRESFLVIANHPSTSSLAVFIGLVCGKLAAQIKAIAKFEHLYNPFGWGMWGVDCAAFINRSNAKTAKASIRKALKKAFETPCNLIIFPCMSRPNLKKIRKDHKRFRGKIPGIEIKLTQTLVPRSGGLHELLSGMDGPIRIINITSAFDVRDDYLGNIADLVGATWHVKVETIEFLTTREDELQTWLNYEWLERKNPTIDAWRTRANLPTSEDITPLANRKVS